MLRANHRPGDVRRDGSLGFKTAQRHALMKEHGFELPMPLENG